MIARLAIPTLLIAGALMAVLYALSVRPAHYSRRHGPLAYGICTSLRLSAVLCMGIVTVCYVYLGLFPPSLPIPARFPWPWGISLALAVLIGAPALWFMLRGTLDAGMESLIPDPSHTMFGGIYRRVRHPQAVGELGLWFALAIGLNSLFLTLFSLIWIPVYVWWSFAEEADLLLRYENTYEEYRARTPMFFPTREQPNGRHKPA